MKIKKIDFNKLQNHFDVISKNDLNAILGGLFLSDGTEINDFEDLARYINAHGINSIIQNKSFFFNESSMNYADIRQNSSGAWGMYLTTPGPTYHDGNVRPGSIGENTINVLDTAGVVGQWVELPEIINLADPSRLSTYAWGDGYAMGIQTSTDMSYENFVENAHGLVFNYVAKTIGNFSGVPIVGPALTKLSEKLINPAHTDSDKSRNDFLIKALMDTSWVDSFTPGTGSTSTLVFHNIHSGDALKMSIGINDLLKAIDADMRRLNFSTENGNLNPDLEAAYMEHFNSTIEAYKHSPDSSFNDLIRAFGGTPSSTVTNPPVMVRDANGNLILPPETQLPTPLAFLEQSKSLIEQERLRNGGIGVSDPATIYFMDTSKEAEKILNAELHETSTDDEVHNQIVEAYNGSFAENIDSSIYTDENGLKWLTLMCPWAPTDGWNHGH